MVKLVAATIVTVAKNTRTYASRSPRAWQGRPASPAQRIGRANSKIAQTKMLPNRAPCVSPTQHVPVVMTRPTTAIHPHRPRARHRGALARVTPGNRPRYHFAKAKAKPLPRWKSALRPRRPAAMTSACGVHQVLERAYVLRASPRNTVFKTQPTAAATVYANGPGRTQNAPPRALSALTASPVRRAVRLPLLPYQTTTAGQLLQRHLLPHQTATAVQRRRQHHRPPPQAPISNAPKLSAPAPPFT